MLVYIIAAITVDGFIGKSADHRSTDWTSPEDKKFFIDRTKKSAAILMGSTTYTTIGRPLPGRLNLVYTRNPQKIDNADKLSQSALSSRARLIHVKNQAVEGPPPTQLLTTNLPPKELIKQLEQECYQELAICGGSTIYSIFMQSGVVNKLYLTLEPIIFGQGIPLFNREINQRLHLDNITHLSNQTLLLEYNVLN